MSNSAAGFKCRSEVTLRPAIICTDTLDEVPVRTACAASPGVEQIIRSGSRRHLKSDLYDMC